MLCPKCGHSEFQLTAPCPVCDFRGEAQALEALSQVDFLLGELSTWTFLPQSDQQQLRQSYEKRRRALLVTLGLRSPPPDKDATRQLRLELRQRSTLLSALPHWVKADVLSIEAAQALKNQLELDMAGLQERLLDAPPTAPPSPDLLALEQARFLAQALHELHETGKTSNLQAYQGVAARLAERVKQLEINLTPYPVAAPAQPVGQAPAPAKSAAALASAPAKSAAAPAIPKARPPRPPWTWDRFLDTLLSERTLNAMLFLGAGLLFAAAVSLVVWNWKAFPPWLQLVFIAAFTGVFYFLGWYVRTRLKLRGSGIALSAVASLLVPLDFYVIYRFGNFSAEAWPQFWLAASLFCLAVYPATTYLIQAEFFAYLTALAAGSTLASAMQILGISQDAWPAALTGLALLLALGSEAIQRRAAKAWQVFVAPVWRAALLGAFTILVLNLSWWLLGRADSDVLRASVAIAWWLGGVLFSLAAWRYRSRLIGLAAVLCFPMALLLSQDIFFVRWNVQFAWHAAGLALFSSLYLWAGRRLGRSASGAALQIHAPTVIRTGVALGALAALWSLGDVSVAALVHPWLAATVFGAAYVWRRPGLVYLGSLLLLSGSATAVASQGASLAQLGLAWALLAILQVVAALVISGRGGKGIGDKGAERGVFGEFSQRLETAGWGSAALALLPPLVSLERDIFTYTLGNWMALNGWLARLALRGEWAGQLILPLARRKTVDTDAAQPVPAVTQPPAPGKLFHWCAALPLPVWFWLTWTGWQPVDARLGVGLVFAAWTALLLGAWLRRIYPSYWQPWQIAAHLAVIAGLFAGIGNYDRPWTAATLLLAASFYFGAAFLSPNRFWLAVGGTFFSLGWLLGLIWLGVRGEIVLVAMAFVPLAYTLGANWLEWRRAIQRDFLKPLYATAWWIIFVVFCWGAALLFAPVFDDLPLLWVAAADALLALTLAWQSWLFESKRDAHLAAWVGVIAVGQVAIYYSRGSGRSAFLAALIAAAYVLSERGLYYAGARQALSARWRSLADRAWQLFGQPLLIVGWCVSAGAIFMALVRNLLILGGGRTRVSWSIAGLLLICGLYALGARLFRQHRPASLGLAWLASILFIAPWSLLTLQGWYIWNRPNLPDYAISWAVLSLLELLVGAALQFRIKGAVFSEQPAQDVNGEVKAQWAAHWAAHWGHAPQVVAHWLLPFALLCGCGDVATSCLTFGLALDFYLLATLFDLRLRRPSPRFLYGAALALPVWLLYLLAKVIPDLTQTGAAALLLGLSSPVLYLGWRVEHMLPEQRAGFGGRRFALPLYLLAYSSLLAGTLLAAHDHSVLILALLFDTLVLGLSSWLFKQPLWIYPAAATLPLALALYLAEWGVATTYQGWALIALGGLYLGAARWLRGAYCAAPRSTQDGNTPRRAYATPLIVAAFALTTLGLIVSCQDRPGAIVACSAVAILYALTSIWLRQPALVTPAVGLVVAAYRVAMLHLGVSSVDFGLALWPLILVCLGLAHFVDWRWGVLADRNLDGTASTSIEPFPWDNIEGWFQAVFERLTCWWALPLYAAAYGLAALSVWYSLEDLAHLTQTLCLATVVYGLATWRFRLRGWLLAAVGCAQLAVLAGLGWWGQVMDRPPSMKIALIFTAVTWVTALAGLFIERRLGEGAPLGKLRMETMSRIQNLEQGWSRPLYGLVPVDLFIVQFIATVLLRAESAWISLSHALLLVVLGAAWVSSPLAYLALALGVLAQWQGLDWINVQPTTWPWVQALMALGYGTLGYGLRFARLRQVPLRDNLAFWERSLRLGGWLLSFYSLWLALFRGVDVIRLAVRAILALPPLSPEDVPRVQMVVGVLAVLGLFYLTAAAVDRKRWLGYTAFAMLLGAWSLEWLLIWGQREVQWYAIPAGVYLLGIGYLEWKFGSRELARWVERAAVLLLLGSSFWQSLGDLGGRYALLMGVEGLLLLWWGSARRLRRFLYAGVGGVTLDVIGQLIEPLLSANRWIVFGVAGLLLVGVAILIERRLEAVMALSQEVRRRLEKWE